MFIFILFFILKAESVVRYYEVFPDIPNIVFSKYIRVLVLKIVLIILILISR